MFKDGDHPRHGLHQTYSSILRTLRKFTLNPSFLFLRNRVKTPLPNTTGSRRKRIFPSCGGSFTSLYFGVSAGGKGRENIGKRWKKWGKTRRVVATENSQRGTKFKEQVTSMWYDGLSWGRDAFEREDNNVEWWNPLWCFHTGFTCWLDSQPILPYPLPLPSGPFFWMWHSTHSDLWRPHHLLQSSRSAFLAVHWSSSFPKARSLADAMKPR